MFSCFICFWCLLVTSRSERKFSFATRMPWEWHWSKQGNLTWQLSKHQKKRGISEIRGWISIWEVNKISKQVNLVARGTILRVCLSLRSISFFFSWHNFTSLTHNYFLSSWDLLFTPAWSIIQEEWQEDRKEYNSQPPSWLIHASLFLSLLIVYLYFFPFRRKIQLFWERQTCMNKTVGNDISEGVKSRKKLTSCKSRW